MVVSDCEGDDGDGESGEDPVAVADGEACEHSPEITIESEPAVVESQPMEDAYVDPDSLALDEPPATQPQPVTPEAKPMTSEPSGSSLAGSSTDLPSAIGLESEVEQKRQKIEMIKSGASKPWTVYHNIRGNFGLKRFYLRCSPSIESFTKHTPEGQSSLLARTWHAGSPAAWASPYWFHAFYLDGSPSQGKLQHVFLQSFLRLNESSVPAWMFPRCVHRCSRHFAHDCSGDHRPWFCQCSLRWWHGDDWWFAGPKKEWYLSHSGSRKIYVWIQNMTSALHK